MRKTIQSWQHRILKKKGDIPTVKRAIQPTVTNAKQENYLEEKWILMKQS